MHPQWSSLRWRPQGRFSSSSFPYSQYGIWWMYIVWFVNTTLFSILGFYSAYTDQADCWWLIWSYMFGFAKHLALLELFTDRVKKWKLFRFFFGETWIDFWFFSFLCEVLKWVFIESFAGFWVSLQSWPSFLWLSSCNRRKWICLHGITANNC